jgi:hypothetical protein
MHQVFATLFSLLVAFTHHSGLQSRTVASAEFNDVVVTTPNPGEPAMLLPNRYQLARYSAADGGYAGRYASPFAGSAVR